MPDLSRPEVAVNFALTWDGRISTRNRTPSDFSSARDKQRLLEIRATGDAVLIGRTTLETENDVLGLPDEPLREERVRRGMPSCPLRVVASNSGRLDPGLRLFRRSFSPVVVFSTTQMPEATRAALASAATLHLTAGASVDLREMLGTLHREYAVKRLICEGGPTLLRSLLELDLVDELNLTFCPRIFGGENAPTLTGCAGEFLPVAREGRLEKMEVIGEECFARYSLRPEKN